MQLIWHVYWGASLSAIWLVVIGAWLAVHQDASDGMVSIHSAGNQIFRHLGTIAVLISVASLVAAMATNAYSGMLSAVTVADSFVKMSPTGTIRIAGIGALAAIWLVISLSLTANAMSTLYTALSIMLYLLVPWTAVNLVDFFFVRHGRYAIDQLFVPNGIYSNWGWQGLASYFVGFLASVPFCNLQGVYQGPVARYLGDVDIAWAPGLAVAGALYAAFMRFTDLGPEIQALEERQDHSVLDRRTFTMAANRFSKYSKPSATL